MDSTPAPVRDLPIYEVNPQKKSSTQIFDLQNKIDSILIILHSMLFVSAGEEFQEFDSTIKTNYLNGCARNVEEIQNCFTKLADLQSQGGAS